MQVATKTVIDIATDEIISRETFDYTGPIAHAFSVGGSSSKQQSNQQSTSQSGTRFNPDFMSQALNYFGSKPPTQEQTNQLNNLQNEYNQRYQASINSGQPDPQLNILNDQINTMKANAQAGNAAQNIPTYNPTYTPATYTPAAPTATYTGATYTPVDQGDFAKIEAATYGSQASKLKQAYDTAQAQQREQLAQSGALNSPSQFLEGSARSSLDRTYINNLQQAARDASLGTLNLKQQEAARQTGFDVGQAAAKTGFGQAQQAFGAGEAARQTGFSTGEAGRQTAFSQDQQKTLLDIFNQYMQYALQSGQFSTGQSTGQSQGGSSGFNFGLPKVGTIG